MRWSLIEVVWVVVLLGIIASIALPRLSVLSQARKVKQMEHLREKLEINVNEIHENWQIMQKNKVPYKNSVIHVNSKGWPTIDDANLEQNTGLKWYKKVIGKSLGKHRYKSITKPAPKAGRVSFSLQTNCRVNYDALTGRVTVVTSGC